MKNIRLLSSLHVPSTRGDWSVGGGSTDSRAFTVQAQIRTSTFSFFMILCLMLNFGVNNAQAQQAIVRTMGTDCINSNQAFYISNCFDCSQYSWSVTGSHTTPSSGYNNSGLASFQWTAAGGVSVSVSYNSGGQTRYLTNNYTIQGLSPSPSVSISPQTVNITYQTPVTFIATPSNAGTSQSYSWYLNNQNVGTNSTQYTNSTLQNGDKVHLTMLITTSQCVAATGATSNTVTANVTYPISAPVVSDVEAWYNTTTTLTASGAGANETYRWYETLTGGSPAGQGLNFTTPVLTNHKTYYVSKYNTSNGGESQRVQLQVTLTLPPPDMPGISTNTCGPKTLTRGTPPASVYWLWQGTDPNGMATSNSATTYTVDGEIAQTYYIRAKAATANIWSAATGIKAAANPVSITVNAYQPSEPLVQATHSITLSPGFTVSAGNTFNARIAITSECNDFINWIEQIGYDKNGQPIGRSKSYSDALGRNLQNQSIDYLTGKVWVTQPLYDAQNNPTASTMPAPILERDFIFKKSFVQNQAGQAYSSLDFDNGNGNNPGGLINPVPVGNQPGTLGWYYSNANTFEPRTATTNYPYARSYTPVGPDPVISKAASPGDALKMGSGKESSSERLPLKRSEITHYLQLQNHFSTLTESNLLGNPDATSTAGYTATSSAITINSEIVNGQSYVRATSFTNSVTNDAGILPLDGVKAVVPGQTYTFRLKGHRPSPSGISQASNAALVVRNASTGANIVWPGPNLPLGISNEAWMEVTFTVPAGCTAISVGVLWTQIHIGASFLINNISLTGGDTYGYKYLSTNPDGTKAMSFVSGEGRTIASALVTNVTGTAPSQTFTYDNWSYTYYNDLGQVVAEVAPNGVNTASTALPNFVTYYKYDHLGRLIETTSPDEGTSRYVYSLDGKIRFSENQEQRNANPKRFSYTNYDYQGRLIESGEYTSTAGGFVFEPYTTTTPLSNSVLTLLENTGFTGTSRKLDASRCTDYTFIEYDVAGSSFTADALHPAQRNLQHQVSKTENANASTWYSYDEFGQLAWTKQTITGFATKTVDYTYDYFGNVTEVAYQKDQPDAYYHHYAYDLNQRLTSVHTSTDGAAKTLHATYTYYLHGPLKRVVLGNNIQGIDYTYNVDGSLKAINHADNALDPGGDGNDAFGMTLNYYDNDYQGAGYNVGTQSLSAVPNQYGGALKSVSWHNHTDNHQKRTYTFAYDNRYQLQNATFGDMTGSGGSYGFTAAAAEAHREGVPACDKNGNIQSLIRKGQTGNVLGNYSYVYEPNTNRLDKVNHNGSLMADYTYNAIGQMTEQQNADNSGFRPSYNAYGLVSEIRNRDNVLLTSYTYDDRGDLVKKTVNSGAVYTHTWYVHDASGNPLAVYTQGQAEPVPAMPAERPIYGAGRIATYKTYSNTNYYEVNDHLGNVRALIGVPQSMTVTATMETANQGTEQQQFLRYGNQRIVNAAIFDHTNASGSQNSTRLSGSANEKTGLARSFAVSPGDVVKLEVFAKYVDNDRTDVSTALNTLVNAIAAGTAAPGTVVDGGAYSTNSSNPFPYAGLMATSSTSGPKAYLNYLFFDKNFVFNLSKSGFVAVSPAAKELGADGPHERLYAEINVTEVGYVYAYLSNDAPTPIEVYFDDFSVTHIQSPIVAGADYYPFGLVMDGREIDDEPYKYGYQGQYSEYDSLTKWNQFDWRMYDPKIARFTTPDPYGQYASSYMGMGNNPVNGVDPDGGYFSMFSWQGSLIGAAVGAGIGLAVDKDNWGWYALGGAAAGGFLASDFAKVEIWGTHQGRGVYYPNSNGPGVSGREYITKAVKNPKMTTTFDILVRHDPWDPGNGLWGKLDGHVFMIINGVDKSFRPTTTRNDGGKSIPPGSENKNLILSDGWVGSAPGYVGATRGNLPAGQGYSHTEMRVRTTVDKKKALLDNINKAALNPPNYSFFIGKRCASFAMKMMRTSKVVPGNSIFHQFSPRALENYMLRRPGTKLLRP